VANRGCLTRSSFNWVIQIYTQIMVRSSKIPRPVATLQERFATASSNLLSRPNTRGKISEVPTKACGGFGPNTVAGEIRRQGPTEMGIAALLFPRGTGYPESLVNPEEGKKRKNRSKQISALSRKKRKGLHFSPGLKIEKRPKSEHRYKKTTRPTPVMKNPIAALRHQTRCPFSGNQKWPVADGPPTPQPKGQGAAPARLSTALSFGPPSLHSPRQAPRDSSHRVSHRSIQKTSKVHDAGACQLSIPPNRRQTGGRIEGLPWAAWGGGGGLGS